jgi:hypothetical protein
MCREVIALRFPPVYFRQRRLLKGCAVATSNMENGRPLRRNAGVFAARLWEESMIMTDDANAEELWRRLAEESPHASDDEIERLFIAAAKDNEDFIRQITEWVFQ